MESLTTRSSRRLAIELLAASFVVLFLELTLIRFLPGQVRILCLRAGRGSLLAGCRPACW